MGDHRLSNKPQATVVLLPVPAMGHLLAMVELAKHLLLHSSTADSDLDLAITILNMQPLVPNPHVSSYIASVSSHPSITFHDLPKVEPPPSSKPEDLMAAVLDLQIPLVRNALQDVHIPVTALVLDLLFSNMVDVAKELGIPSYVFFASGAAFLGLMLHASAIAPQLPSSADQYEGKSLDFPGFANPLPLMSMPEPLMDPNVGVQHVSRFASRYPEVTGILINTLAELQPAPLKALEDGLYHLKAQAVYAVGPILSLDHKPDATAGTEGRRHECLRWLDEQPQGSVVFLCFGSMGSFPTDQARETAAGLEASGQRFLWVLRSPPLQKAQRTPVDAVLDEVLPEGFLDRTRNRGMVWPSFAPQAQILAHAAVGGFVTHCGWNSCLESIWYGVPMAAWPLYAEQHFNAFEMVRELGIAVEVRIDRNRGNAATADEVERAVRLLMGEEEGRPVRERAAEMKLIARSAVDKGGSSFLALQKFVKELIR